MKPALPPPYFIGNYLLSVDAKNRIIIPPLFRDILNTYYKDDNNTVILSISIEMNINVHPLSSYKAFVESMKQLPELKTDVRILTSVFAMFSFAQEVDGAGRIAIEPLLLKKAEIGKEAYIVGVWSHFQIWRKEKFEVISDDYLRQMYGLGDKIYQSFQK